MASRRRTILAAANREAEAEDLRSLDELSTVNAPFSTIYFQCVRPMPGHPQPRVAGGACYREANAFGSNPLNSGEWKYSLRSKVAGSVSFLT